MAFFLGLLSPLNINKGRVIRGGKGIQICSTWNYIQGLVYKGEYKRKRWHILSFTELQSGNHEINGTVVTFLSKAIM